MKKTLAMVLLGLGILSTVLLFANNNPPPGPILPPGNCGPVYSCTYRPTTGFCEGTSGLCQCLDCHP
ncbi:MAG: hypothetical protein ACOYXN_05085 [Acidobacteriota bacterium]